jgi:catechol 2,3-dioxygenase-like lactoylglutathione lyase family enzyme
MALNLLAHYSIRTTKLAETRDFYCDLLGLHDGARPQFNFPGHWLYLGDRDVVHLVGIDPHDSQGLKDYLGDKPLDALTGSGSVDHVAFFATDLAAMHRRLKERGASHRDRSVPSLGLHQVFIEDPNGITIELNYPAAEATGNVA